MRVVRFVALSLGLAFCFLVGAPTESEAGYYSSWGYRNTYRYYYTRYHYTNRSGADRYHYCIYYPSKPRYVYYYNPYKRVYWGRLDLEGKKGSQYSLLADKDRKEKLNDIPESAFPKPGPMPKVPETDGDERIEVPKDLPDVSDGN